MDLRLIRAFVAVAETENVGLAAERLHISQSPLSRQILQLEAQLGLTLFERSRQRVRLTDEGREFLAVAQDLLVQVRHVKAQARRLASGASGSLAIGYVEAAMHCGLLPGTLRRLKARYPEVNLTLHALSSASQAEALSRRRIDVGLVYAPPDDRSVVSSRIHDEPIVLALPPGHTLTGCAEIHAADLDGLPWIALPERRNPRARQRFLGHCRAFGFEPDIQLEAEDLLAVLNLVAADLGATFIQSSLRDAFPERLAFRDVPNFPASVQIFAIRRADDPKPLVTAFQDALRQAGLG